MENNPTAPHEHHATHETLTEQRKEKIKGWLSDPYNLSLIGIIALALAIRIFYFVVTKNQPLWWDEASYMSIAKRFAFGYFENSEWLKGEMIIRPLFLPILITILMKLSASEAVIRFFLEVIPSVLSVFVIYLILGRMYDKKTALFGSFLASVLWIHLFYSMRIMTDVPAVFLGLISIYFFWKAYQNNYDLKNTSIAFLFLSLTFLMRYPFGVLGFSYLIFMLVTERMQFFKNKNIWIASIAFIIPIAIYLGINYLLIGSIFPALGVYSASAAQKPGFAWYVLDFFFQYLGYPLFFIFILGAAGLILNLAIGTDILFKRKNKLLDNDFFIFILLLAPMIYFIFIMKAAEDRYLFAGLISIIAITSRGLSLAYNYIKKYNTAIAAIIIAVILIFGAYSELNHATQLINQKKESYLQMKEAFSWIKDHSNPEDIVVSGYGGLYSMYYGERDAIGFPENESELNDMIKKSRPKYFVLHAFNSHPAYIYSYPNDPKNNLQAVNAFYFDQEKKQPAAVIYQFIYSNSSLE